MPDPKITVNALNNSPKVNIIIQPEPWGSRFRDNSKRNGGAISYIKGKNSTAKNQLEPTIEVFDPFRRSMTVIISCVTKDPPGHYLPHPYKLVGENCHPSGIYYRYIDFEEDSNFVKIVLSKIGIQIVKQRDIPKSLQERKEMNVNPFKSTLNFMDYIESQDDLKLPCLRLAIQIFFNTDKIYKLRPIVTDPIFDERVNNKTLEIIRLSHNEALKKGGQLVFLLCNKLIHHDTIIKFMHEESKWESYAKLIPPFHIKQLVLIFETPEYNGGDESRITNVTIQLERKSDGKKSNEFPFRYVTKKINDEKQVVEQKCPAKKLLAKKWNYLNPDTIIEETFFPYENLKNNTLQDYNKPYMEIAEQPISTIRFLYENDSKASSFLQSGNVKNPFITVKFFNNKHHKIFLTLNCVQSYQPYGVHPNKIITKINDSLTQKGCFLDIPIEPNQKEFKFEDSFRFSIQMVKRNEKYYKKRVEQIKQINIDPFNVGWDHLRNEKRFDLHCLRLCFSAYFIEGNQIINLDPIVSDIIQDSRVTKKPVILGLSHATSPVSGGTYLTILCEHIDASAEVIFFKVNENNLIIWEKRGKTVYHHDQVALVCSTPEYFKQDINDVIDVMVQIIKNSDDLRSNPVIFGFRPYGNHKSDNLDYSDKLEKKLEVELPKKGIVRKYLTSTLDDIKPQKKKPMFKQDRINNYVNTETSKVHMNLGCIVVDKNKECKDVHNSKTNRKSIAKRDSKSTG